MSQTRKAEAASLHGRFLWYELMTSDTEAAKAFYSDVVGWDALDASTSGMAYTLFTVAEVSVAGLMQLPDVRKPGAPPRWMGYVGVNNVDATADRIKQLGGAILIPPTEIPGISRFSVVADPQMATFALIKWLRARQDLPAPLDAPGRVGWHELFATDCEKAFTFYRELFAWQKGEATVDVTGTYQAFCAGGQPIGAMFTKAATLPMPFWLYYFNIDDIDAVGKRVKAGGGQILNDPFEARDGNWVVQCTDPQGAVFALIGKRKRNPIGYFERTSRDPSDQRRRRWSW